MADHEPVVHAAIRPIKALLQSKFLYDMDETKKDLIKCQIEVISSYPGHVLSSFVWIPETEGVFSYIPLHALQWKEAITDPLDWDDVVFQNCPDSDISISHLPIFKRATKAFFPKKKRWIKGSYLFTIDWFRDNVAVNLLKLENGQFAAVPFHKSLYGKGVLETLPDYKKLRPEWVL